MYKRQLLVQRSPGAGMQMWFMMALVAAQLMLWGLYEAKWTKLRLPLAIALMLAQIAVEVAKMCIRDRG